MSDAISNFLWEIGASGVELGDVGATSASVKGYFNSKDLNGDSALKKVGGYIASLWEMGLVENSPGLFISEVEEKDWAETSRESFKPLSVSERITVFPPWEYTEELCGTEVAVIINPGMAFGTGRHETTRISLHLLEMTVLPGSRVLDFGTGSGILSIAAVKLGAAYALGLDLDELAVKNALENVKLNGLSDRVEVRLTYGGLEVDREFDIVVANIRYDVIVSHLEDLLGACSETGHLIFSGILAEEGELFSRRLKSGGLRVIHVEREGDWIGLLTRR